MTNSASEFRDEPRTWRELFSDWVDKHSTGVFLVAALLIGLQLAGNTLLYIHFYIHEFQAVSLSVDIDPWMLHVDTLVWSTLAALLFREAIKP